MDKGQKRDGRRTNPLALLLHTWRLRRIRWATETLNRRLTVYETAYGCAAVRLRTEDLEQTGLRRIAEV